VEARGRCHCRGPRTGPESQLTTITTNLADSLHNRYFSFTCDVRQGGVLSPVLFNIYVDSIIERLRMSGYGCVIGDEFFGCIMYADDLVLVYHSVCALQKMIVLMN